MDHLSLLDMQVATQAIGHMPSLLLFPLVPFVLEVALVFWWVFVAAYLYSSGTYWLLLCSSVPVHTRTLCLA